MKHLAPVLALLSTIVAYSTPAQAYVTSMPGFHHFGNVEQYTTGWTTIWFQNNGPVPLTNFNVYCYGDSSQFNCSPSCFYLPAYGSCTVSVQFRPMRGDNRTYQLTVQGSGSGQSAASYVSGVDRPRN